MQVEVAGRSVAMFRELEANHTFFAVLAVLLPEEQNEVGVGLERARFAKIRKHRLGAALLDLPRELRKRDDRDLELARDRLQRSADAGDLEDAALLVRGALDELEVVDDHEVETALGLKASRLREDVGHVEPARLLDEDRRLLQLARRGGDRGELLRGEAAAAHPVPVDLGAHRDQALHDLHLAHLHREERAGLLLHDGGVLDDVERETRLAKTRTACDQDQIGGLQTAGLLVDRLDSGADTDAEVAARVDLLGIAAQRDVQRNDIAVERRFAHGEEELLRVRHGGRGLLASEGEARDLVRDADQPAKEGGPLDDRRIAGRVRDRRHVLHETDEELRAADRVELVVREELRLHGRETDRFAALRDAGDRAKDDTVLLARQVGRSEAAARHPDVAPAVLDDPAHARRLG